MPLIVVSRSKDTIKISGHAGYAENGKDIVCSAVSALVQTLIMSVKELTDDVINYDIQPGAAYIKFWSLSELSRALVGSFLIGIRMIADEYPGNVCIYE